MDPFVPDGRVSRSAARQVAEQAAGALRSLPSAGSYQSGTTVVYVAPGPDAIRVRLTAGPQDSRPLYDWEEVQDDGTGYGWETTPGGRTGTQNATPTNGDTAIPADPDTGTIVWIRPATTPGFYEFDWNSAFNTTVNNNNTTINNDNSTINNDNTTINNTDTTINYVTDTVTYDDTTITYNNTTITYESTVITNITADYIINLFASVTWIYEGQNITTSILEFDTLTLNFANINLLISVSQTWTIDAGITLNFTGGPRAILNLTMPLITIPLTTLLTIADTTVLKFLTGTKGDLPYLSGSGIMQRLPAGADDLLLITDSTTTAGLKYGVAKPAGGGTGASSLSAHGVVIGNGTSAVNVTGAGTAGQVLTSNGPAADPSFQDVAGLTNPMTTLGDIIYEDGTPAPARLAGNTSATPKLLKQTGTGLVSAAPVWDTLDVADIPEMAASGTGHQGGAVPDPGGTAGSTKFLREDATWAAPAISNIDLTGIAGYNGAVQQILGHDASGVLTWYNVGSC